MLIFPELIYIRIDFRNERNRSKIKSISSFYFGLIVSIRMDYCVVIYGHHCSSTKRLSSNIRHCPTFRPRKTFCETKPHRRHDRENISLTTTELRRASNTLTGDKIKIWKSDEEDAPPFGLLTAVSHLRYTIYCTSFCTFLFGFRSPASSRMMNERIDSNGDGEEEKKKKESSHQCDTIIASLDVSMGTRYTRTGLFVSCCPFA